MNASKKWFCEYYKSTIAVKDEQYIAVTMNVFHFHPWEAWLGGEKSEYGNLRSKAFTQEHDNTGL